LSSPSSRITSADPAETLAPATQRPGRVRRVLGCALAALTVAALGAAVGGWIGWRSDAPLIGSDAATATVAQVTGAAGNVRVERHDYDFRYAYPGSAARIFIGDDDYESGYVTVTATSVDASIDAVRAGLAATGWRVTDDPFQEGVAARRGTVVVSITDGDDHTLSFEFERAQPSPVRWLTVLGWLLGFAVGLVTARLVIRSGRRAVYAGVIGTVLLLPGTIVTTGDLVQSFGPPDTVQPVPPWGDYLFLGVRALSTVGVLALVISVVFAITTRSTSTDPARSTRADPI
jgi:hypothetical protein